MRRLTIALAITIAAAGSAGASQETDVMRPVQQFFDGFNKGDVAMAQAVCVDETFIIDDFPPHAWHGAGATSQWLNDYNAYAKANGVTDGMVTLGKARHIDVTGDHAYVVVETSISLKKEGKSVKHLGLMTLALDKGANGWRITAWAWADQ